MKTPAVLCVVCGLAAGVPGQQVDRVLDASEVSLGAGYSSRALSLRVYDVGTPAQSGGVWTSSGVNAYDDVTVGGPGASGPVNVSGIEVALVVPTTAPAGQQVFGRFSFYPNHDAGVAPGAEPYSGTPVVASAFIMEVDGSWPSPTPLNVVLDDSNVFGPGDRTMGLKIELFLDAALTVPANNWQVVRRGNLTGAMPVGSSDSFGWFSGTTVSSGSIVNSQRSGGTQSNNRATYAVLYGTYDCGTADFDGDGDTATDADIEAFFACLAGNCCATCWAGGADFNADGDTATDADIEAFFRVLAGGNC